MDNSTVDKPDRLGEAIAAVKQTHTEIVEIVDQIKNPKKSHIILKASGVELFRT